MKPPSVQPTLEPAAFGVYSPGRYVGAILALSRGMPPSWLGRRIGYALRRLAAPALQGQPFDVQAFGARMRLHPYNNVCERRLLFTPRFFDEAERIFLARRIHADFVFIDIGANVGGYTMFVASREGPRARILAIEPQAAIFERLVENIRFNGFSCVKALDCAIADRSGEITLFIASHNVGESSIRIVPSRAASQVRVPAKSLWAIVEAERFARIDAIKLDVEGAEDIILGAFFDEAPQSLWPRAIVMECIDRRAAARMATLLQSKGYREALRTRRNVAYALDED